MSSPGSPIRITCLEICSILAEKDNSSRYFDDVIPMGEFEVREALLDEAKRHRREVYCSSSPILAVLGTGRPLSSRRWNLSSWK